MNEILAHASRLTKSGLSVIPIKPDGTKAPDLLTWKPFQGEIADPSTLENWFENGERGLAVIGGSVSGNLEILDFDDPKTAENYGELIRQEGPNSAFQRSNSGDSVRPRPQRIGYLKKKTYWIT